MINKAHIIFYVEDQQKSTEFYTTLLNHTPGLNVPGEWMRFEEDSPVSEIIKQVPHVAFEVDNLDEAIKGKKLLGKISSPSEGVRVAMIIENGAPVELINKVQPEKPIEHLPVLYVNTLAYKIYYFFIESGRSV